MTSAAYSMSYERQFTADFTTTPVFIEESVILYKKPEMSSEFLLLFIQVNTVNVPIG